jgi:DNA-binding PadR family transcriptional regulator
VGTDSLRGLRLDVAVALNGQHRTLYETAKALGRRSGDIQRVVRQMLAEGVLVADTDPPTRGTLYSLAPEHVETLEAVLGDTQPHGQVVESQRVLVLTAPDGARLYRALGRSDLTAVVSWAAEFGGDGQWVIALSRAASKLQADRLQIALQALGFDCEQRRVGEVLSADALRRLAAAVDDATYGVISQRV